MPSPVEPLLDARIGLTTVQCSRQAFLVRSPNTPVNRAVAIEQDREERIFVVDAVIPGLWSGSAIAYVIVSSVHPVADSRPANRSAVQAIRGLARGESGCTMPP